MSGQAQLLGDRLQIRLPPLLGGQALLGLEHLVCRVTHGARDSDGTVITEKAAQLSGNHRHTVGGKLHILVQVKAVYGLDKPYAAHLEQVIHTLAPIGKFLHHGQHQPQIAGNQLFSGGAVSLLGKFQQTSGLGAL